MDVAVLLLFASFITAATVATISRTEVLRTSARRPRLFRFAVVGAAAVTVPADLYAVVYGTVGSHSARLAEVADRLVLLNVAAACGVAALHGCLRGRALAGSAPAVTLPGAAAACSPGSGLGSRPGSFPGSGSDSGGRVDDGYALRIAVRSLLGCAISASSLFRKAGAECDRSSGGMRVDAGSAPWTVGRWSREGYHRHNPVPGAEPC
jgi:hypothetical protein